MPEAPCGRLMLMRVYVDRGVMGQPNPVEKRTVMRLTNECYAFDEFLCGFAAHGAAVNKAEAPFTLFSRFSKL